MGQVTLKINGYPYVLGCPDGQEAHLEALGAELDARVSSIRAQVGNLGEARLLAMAGIMLADELADARAGQAPAPSFEAEAAERLTRLARRLDGVASKLARA
ncbi:cell division protein ZapA [Elioraea tepidiphila]|jgi:cell division protein ZapA|uniref:cell division protein ZapA n=1 Tax=Elioraea tepidiphila TaxID=457934 RepID=UPI00036B05F5|nr:cell division protein ZapA [Elioraea tepidiphila]